MHWVWSKFYIRTSFFWFFSRVFPTLGTFCLFLRFTQIFGVFLVFFSCYYCVQSTQKNNSVNNAQNFLQSHFLQNRKFMPSNTHNFFNDYNVKFSVFCFQMENRKYNVVIVEKIVRIWWKNLRFFIKCDCRKCCALLTDFFFEWVWIFARAPKFRLRKGRIKFSIQIFLLSNLLLKNRTACPKFWSFES
jgi:hypothetical protein